MLNSKMLSVIMSIDIILGVKMPNKIALNVKNAARWYTYRRNAECRTVKTTPAFKKVATYKHSSLISPIASDE
jgi:hypothetical protein